MATLGPLVPSVHEDDSVLRRLGARPPNRLAQPPFVTGRSRIVHHYGALADPRAVVPAWEDGLVAAIVDGLELADRGAYHVVVVDL